MAVRRISVVTALAILSGAVAAQQKIYWGDDVPAGLEWAMAGRRCRPSPSAASSRGRCRPIQTPRVHHGAASGRAESMHVVNMFTSPMRKVAPAIVLANPRVTSPQQARASGKPVVFLLRQHPSA